MVNKSVKTITCGRFSTLILTHDGVLMGETSFVIRAIFLYQTSGNKVVGTTLLDKLAWVKM